MIPARAYIFDIAALRRLYGDLYNTPGCPKPGHGNSGMKICAACGRTACAKCDPTFCECQVKGEKT